MQHTAAKGIAVRIAIIFAAAGLILFIISMITQEELILTLGVVMFVFCSLCFCIANGVDETETKKKKVHPTKIITIKTNGSPVTTVCTISNV